MRLERTVPQPTYGALLKAVKPELDEQASRYGFATEFGTALVRLVSVEKYAETISKQLGRLYSSEFDSPVREDWREADDFNLVGPPALLPDLWLLIQHVSERAEGTLVEGTEEQLAEIREDIDALMKEIEDIPDLDEGSRDSMLRACRDLRETCGGALATRRKLRARRGAFAGTVAFEAMDSDLRDDEKATIIKRADGILAKIGAILRTTGRVVGLAAANEGVKFFFKEGLPPLIGDGSSTDGE